MTLPIEGQAEPASYVTTAEALGSELARALVVRAPAPAEGVTAFARSLSLDADRLHVELIYLWIFTTQFAIGAAFGPGSARDEVLAAFDKALRSTAWRASAQGVAARSREYRDAFNHPHPELGRANGVGRTFARHCGCSREIAAIEFGARAYMEQLAPLMDFLRSVRLV